MEQTQKILFTIFALIVAVILVMCVDSIFVETVETYEFTAVITHMDAVRDYNEVSYLISWVDGDKSDVAKVDAATYARYEEGDFIDIGVRVTETRIFHTELTDYKILT